MDTKEGKLDTRGCPSTPVVNTNGTDTDFVLQWGNKKRNRCNKLKANNGNFIQKSHSLPIANGKSTPTIGHQVVPVNKCSSSPQHQENHVKRSESPGNNRKTSVASPEKEDRYYTTRGSFLDDNGKVLVDNVKKDKKLVWPKLFVALSCKEKEEDFMAMKGCKPPHRPKKRAKLIQRSVVLVCPGGWLSELCQERYEVREKKTSKKRPRGLKAMGSMESDSE